MKRFVLQRNVDETGISGTGDIAEGVLFSDGTAVLRWLTFARSTGIYASIGEMETIHGHGGKTVVRWVDEPPVQIDPVSNAPINSSPSRGKVIVSSGHHG
jgi:hypothetical protein